MEEEAVADLAEELELENKEGEDSHIIAKRGVRRGETGARYRRW